MPGRSHVRLWADPLAVFEHEVATLNQRLPLSADAAAELVRQARDAGSTVVTTVADDDAHQIANVLRADTLTVTVEGA